MALFHTTVLDNQIKALPTVDTASGSVATFDTDLTENLIEVKCQILAKQGGSGTPSPSNPRPITTYSEMNVSATGKNLFNPLTQFNAISYYLVANNILPNTKCIMSFVDKDPSVDISNIYFGFLESGYSGGILPTNHYRWVISNGVIQSNSTNITPLMTCTSLFVYPNKQTVLDTLLQRFDIQIEKGSTATTFEPFNGTTANIPFGQTVANGVLDVTTGKLKATHGVVDLGSLTWYYASAQNCFYTGSVSGSKTKGNIVCSIYETNIVSVGSLSDYQVSTWNSFVEHGIITKDSRYSDAPTYKTAMNGIIAVYELDTPIEIQLDSVQIQALLNENNIWCDTGDTEVKYLLTVGKKIS